MLVSSKQISTVAVSLLALGIMALGGCSDDDGDVKGSAGGATRSPTCLAWQDATCDKLADTCGSVSREDCDDLVQSFYCKSDGVMQSCINATNAASCTDDTPPECRGVIDNQPAIAYCYRFVDKVCARYAACDLLTVTQCKDAIGFDCGDAIGVTPNGPTCEADVPTHSCDALAASQLPPACIGVLTMNN